MVDSGCACAGAANIKRKFAVVAYNYFGVNVLNNLIIVAEKYYIDKFLLGVVAKTERIFAVDTIGCETEKYAPYAVVVAG